MVLPKIKKTPKCEKYIEPDHDSNHGHRNLNDTERSATARHRNFNAPKICKITVSRTPRLTHTTPCSKVSKTVSQQQCQQWIDIHTVPSLPGLCFHVYRPCCSICSQQSVWRWLPPSAMPMACFTVSCIGEHTIKSQPCPCDTAINSYPRHPLWINWSLGCKRILSVCTY